MRDEHVSFRRAWIEALPFADGWFDDVISNGVVNLSPGKWCPFAEATRVLAREDDWRSPTSSPSEKSPRAPTVRPDCGPHASPGPAKQDLYLEDLAAAGLELQLVRPNSSYRFTTTGAANEREVRRAQDLAPGDQTPTCFPPPRPPRFG